MTCNLHYVEVDPASGNLIYTDVRYGGHAKSLLYRYPTDSRVRVTRGTGADAR